MMNRVGLSNAAIGERVFISRHTVTHHLTQGLQQAWHSFTQPTPAAAAHGAKRAAARATSGSTRIIVANLSEGDGRERPPVGRIPGQDAPPLRPVDDTAAHC